MIQWCSYVPCGITLHEPPSPTYNDFLPVTLLPPVYSPTGFPLQSDGPEPGIFPTEAFRRACLGRGEPRDASAPLGAQEWHQVHFFLLFCRRCEMFPASLNVSKCNEEPSAIPVQEGERNIWCSQPSRTLGVFH